MNATLDQLTAYLSVKSIGGVSLYAGNASIRAASIEEFSSVPEDSRRAIGRLREMGFEVTTVSTVNLRVSAPSKTFQKHFGLKFERHQEMAMAMYTPTEKTAGNCLNLGDSLLEGLAFPEPLQTHGASAAKKSAGKKVAAKKGAAKSAAAKKVATGPSATPPVLPYYHLEVPHDIVKGMNAGPVHQSGNKGAGVRAAMIDSGFQWSHPYFVGKGYDLRVALPSGSDADANGHGTGESANFLAVAPKSKLRGLSMDDPITAFQKCRDVLGVQLISNSWGSATDTDGPMSGLGLYWRNVLAEIALCVRAGIIVLFSGGNGGMSVTASTPDTISVGGVYKAKDGSLSASDYASSFDSFRFQTHPVKQEVHVPEVCGLCGVLPRAAYIALPIPAGCEIDRDLGGTPFPNGDGTLKTDGWGVFSGTSAACPMVAGVVALILSRYPDAKLADIRNRLYKATDVKAGKSSHGQSAGPGYDPATGYGLVDAVKALA
jgi:subtilisin family serine protease